MLLIYRPRCFLAFGLETPLLSYYMVLYSVMDTERSQSHPEHSKAVPASVPSVRPSAHSLFFRQGQTQTNDVPRVRGFDDPVVPQSRGGVKRCRLPFDLFFESGMLAWIPTRKHVTMWIRFADDEWPTWTPATSPATAAPNP